MIELNYLAIAVATFAAFVVAAPSTLPARPVPWQLVAIHAGDWLVKLPVIAVIASLWP